MGFGGTLPKSAPFRLLEPLRGWPRRRGRSRCPRRTVHARCADSPVDGSDPPEALWRYRAGHPLADGRAGRARTRRDALCQRRFTHFRAFGAGLAESAAPGWGGTGCVCAAYDDARAGAATRGRFRFPALPLGLLSVLAV